MGKPNNPDIIIIKNKFYPKGLTEGDIWNYYQNNKFKILDETKNRNVTLLIATDVNKIVLRRNLGGKPIRLTPQNFDQIVTGRTLGFYSEMGSYESKGIIDIDVHPDDGFNWSTKATYDVFDFVMDQMPLVRKVDVYYTGKTSFHIVCDFNKKMKIDSIRFLLRKFFSGSNVSKVYSVDYKRQRGIPNIDLSINKLRGNYITLHSLSTIGLRCMPVEYNQIRNFNPRSARIK